MQPESLGFPTSVRLNNAKAFDRVFKTATVRRRNGALRISAVENSTGSARLGLVVGKRALSKAHERNRAKRVLRETFRHSRSELPAMDIIVQVTGDASNTVYRTTFLRLLADISRTQAGSSR